MVWQSENPEKADTEEDTPGPRRYRCKLRTTAEAATEIAKLYRLARSGLLSVDHASKLANILAVMGRLMQGGEIEALTARLDAVEATQGTRSAIGRR